MKAFNGFESKANDNRPTQLPVGAYVAKIKGVKIDGQEPDQALILRVDVCEGPYTDYFLNRYKQDEKKYDDGKSKYPPKYKGDYRVRIPNDENKKAQYPESDKKRFGDMIYRIEESNPGYHWDWDENGLKGLLVGINVREAAFNGHPFTEIGGLEIVSAVREGTVRPMQPRGQRGDADDSQFVAPQIDQQSGFVAVETDELPF